MLLILCQTLSVIACLLVTTRMEFSPSLVVLIPGHCQRVFPLISDNQPPRRKTYFPGTTGLHLSCSTLVTTSVFFANVFLDASMGEQAESCIGI